MNTSLGNQWMMEVYGCDPRRLEKTAEVESVMLNAARLCKATIISSSFHQFQPFGVSGVVVIAESHIAVHTWPERGYAAVDVFTCGESLRPDQAAEYISSQFGAETYQVFKLKRGHFDKMGNPNLSMPSMEESLHSQRELGRLLDGNQWYKETPDDEEHHQFAYLDVLYSGRTRYQKVEILDTLKHGKMLVLDGAIQSAENDEHIYHESLIHPGMMTHPAPKRVLIIGGGEGASLREVLRSPSVEKAVMVDLDPDVVSLARVHLPEWHRGAFDDPRARLVIEDGCTFLEQTTESFDVIVIDVTDSFEEGPARELFTQEFYQLAARRLTHDGLLIVQGLALSSVDFQEHAVLSRTLGTVFPVVRSYKTFVPSFWSEWGFLIASKKYDPVDLSADAIQARMATRFSGRVPTKAGPLRFYGPAIHGSLFVLSETLKESIHTAGYVVRSNKASSKSLVPALAS